MKFNALIPELSVTDIEKSLAFYVTLLGFQIEYRRVEDKFAFVSLQGNQLMLEERNGQWETGNLERPFGRGINFQMQVTSLEPLLNSLSNAKYALLREPRENSYQKGDQTIVQREILVQDTDGHLLRFAQVLRG